MVNQIKSTIAGVVATISSITANATQTSQANNMDFINPQTHSQTAFIQRDPVKDNLLVLDESLLSEIYTKNIENQTEKDSLDQNKKRNLSIKIAGGPSMLYGDRMPAPYPFTTGINAGISLEQQISKHLSLELGLSAAKFEFDNTYSYMRLREWNNQEFIYFLSSLLFSEKGQNAPLDLKAGVGVKLFHSEAQQFDFTTYSMAFRTGGEGYFLDREMFVIPSLKLVGEGRLNSKASIGLEVGKDFVLADRMLDGIDSRKMDNLYFMNLFYKYNFISNNDEASKLLNDVKMRITPVGVMMLYSDFGSQNKFIPDTKIGPFYGLELEKHLTKWLSMTGSISAADYKGENSERDVTYNLWLRKIGLNVGVDATKFITGLDSKAYLTVTLGGSIDFFESILRTKQTNEWLAHIGTTRPGTLLGNEMQGTLETGIKATIPINTKLGLNYSPSIVFVNTFNDDYDVAKLGKNNDCYVLVSPLGFSINMNKGKSDKQRLEEAKAKDSRTYSNKNLNLIENTKKITNLVSSDTASLNKEPILEIKNVESAEDTVKTNIATTSKTINNLMNEGQNYIVKKGDALQNIVKKHYELQNDSIVLFSNAVAEVNVALGRKYMNKDVSYKNKLGEIVKGVNVDHQIGDIIKDTIYLPPKTMLEFIIKEKNQEKNQPKYENQSKDKSQKFANEIENIHAREGFMAAKKVAELGKQDIYALKNTLADSGLQINATLKSLKSSSRAEDMASFLMKKYWLGNTVNDTINDFKTEFNRSISRSTMYAFMDMYSGEDKVRKNEFSKIRA